MKLGKFKLPERLIIGSPSVWMTNLPQRGRCRAYVTHFVGATLDLEKFRYYTSRGPSFRVSPQLSSTVENCWPHLRRYTDRRCCTVTVQIYSNNQHSSVWVDNSWRRWWTGQVMSTNNDDRHLLITLSVQYSAIRPGRDVGVVLGFTCYVSRRQPVLNLIKYI